VLQDFFHQQYFRIVEEDCPNIDSCGTQPVPKLYPLQTVLEGKPRPCHFSEAAVVKILREVPIPVDELGGAKVR